MKNIVCTMAWFMAFVHPVFSQELNSESSNDKIPVQEVNLFFGGASGNFSVFSIADFKALAPTSQLLKQDLSSYYVSSITQVNDHSYLGLMVGVIPGKKNRASKKFSPLLRLGINYENAHYFENNLYRYSSFRYDTLFNSQGQEVYYRDSVVYNGFSMQYQSRSVAVEGSLLLRTNTSKRWMFSLGFGISGGISFGNEVVLLANENRFVDEYEVSGNNSTHGNHFMNYYNSEHNKQEFIDVTSSWVLSGFIPMGVDFRIGKKNEFFKQVHLFSELRPGIKLIDVPGLKVCAGTYLLTGMGLRYVWN